MMCGSDDVSSASASVGDANEGDVASQGLSDSDVDDHHDDEEVEAFKSSRALHEKMLGIAMILCCLACIVPGARLLFTSFIVGVIFSLVLRQVVTRMRDQRVGRRLCGRWAILLANLQWIMYHSVTDAPVVFNARPFLLVMGISYFVCFAIAGTLVTTSAQHPWISIVTLAHNAYAQSLVPAEKKLFTDVEAASLMLIIVVLVVCYYLREAGSLRVGMSESMARQHVAELDRQLTVLEQVRREALVDEASARRARRRRADRVTANATAAHEMLREPTIPEATAPKVSVRRRNLPQAQRR